ncbi:hypothetical protein ABZ471_43500 [Streptomyces sp. NPDC005728]|uniref:hypothetical protein n=1 Tax=Streptomyces sp. NPDC005728 TaxID=3157054 RepID=UPI0034035DDD
MTQLVISGSRHTRARFYVHDFEPSLAQFLGSSAGLSPATVTRLAHQRAGRARRVLDRDLADVDCVYV